MRRLSFIFIFFLIVSIIGLCDGELIRCIIGGFSPSDRLSVKSNERVTMKWKDRWADENTHVCIAMIYEVQWDDGVVAMDIMFGMETHIAIEEVVSQKDAALFHNYTTLGYQSDHVCYDVDVSRMIKEIDNTLDDKGKTIVQDNTNTRFNSGWLCVCYDKNGFCNDLTFIQSRFSKRKHELEKSFNELTVLPVQSINITEYSKTMRELKNVDFTVFGDTGFCFEGVVNHPYGYADLNALDFLNSNSVNNMFYSSYKSGPLWCAISFGRLTSSHASVVPSTTDANIPFAKGAFDPVNMDSLEMKDPHMKQFLFRCWTPKAEIFSQLKHDDWYRPYLPENNNDELVLFCACNADFCNNIENMEIIRSHFLSQEVSIASYIQHEI